MNLRLLFLTRFPRKEEIDMRMLNLKQSPPPSMIEEVKLGIHLCCMLHFKYINVLGTQIRSL